MWQRVTQPKPKTTIGGLFSRERQGSLKGMWKSWEERATFTRCRASRPAREPRRCGRGRRRHAPPRPAPLAPSCSPFNHILFGSHGRLGLLARADERLREPQRVVHRLWELFVSLLHLHFKGHADSADHLKVFNGLGVGGRGRRAEEDPAGLALQPTEASHLNSVILDRLLFFLHDSGSDRACDAAGSRPASAPMPRRGTSAEFSLLFLMFVALP